MNKLVLFPNSVHWIIPKEDDVYRYILVTSVADHFEDVFLHKIHAMWVVYLPISVTADYSECTQTELI